MHNVAPEIDQYSFLLYIIRSNTGSSPVDKGAARSQTFGTVLHTSLLLNALPGWRNR